MQVYTNACYLVKATIWSKLLRCIVREGWHLQPWLGGWAPCSVFDVGDCVVGRLRLGIGAVYYQ